jgi:hypothetical protein
VAGVYELDAQLRPEVDPHQRMLLGDPPDVEVTIDGVAHQELFVSVAEVTRGEELDVVPDRAKILSLQRVAHRIDPPVVEVMVAHVEDQENGRRLAIGGGSLSQPRRPALAPPEAQ